MTKRVVIVVVALAAILVGVLLWHARSHEAPTMATGSGATARGATGVSPPVIEPARALVTVSDAKGPLAGAIVRLAGPNGDIATGKTSTDGVARVDALAAGSWTASASAPDHVPAAAKPVAIKAGDTATIAIVLLPGGRPLAGIVTDASGGPVAGARVDAARLGGLARPSDAIATTLTGADGRYKLTIDEGQIMVAVNHGDYAPQSRYVDVGASGAIVDFQLVPGGVIEGVVRDERTKEPVAGARVEAARDSAMPLGEVQRRHATAGPDGHFRITGLRPGSFELSAELLERYSRAPTIVGLGVAEQVSDVVILVATGSSIRGTVVDETGAPAPDVQVGTFADRGWEADNKSDANGAFVLAGIPPGKYELIGSSDVFVAAGTTPVEVGAKDAVGVVVHVRRGGRVKGHVEPRQVCELRLDFDDSALGPQQLPMLLAPMTTGADGEFSFGPASPIAYVLAARCPSGDQGSKKITVAPNAPDVVLEVTAGASVAGRVVDGGGKPVAAVIVSAVAQGGSERTTIVNGVVTNGAQVLTGATGAFEIKGLEAGAFRLRVLDRGRPVPLKRGGNRFELAANEHKTGMDVAIDRPDGVIRGTVTGPDGKPLADAWVSVQQSLDDLVASMTHPDPGESDSRTVMVQNDGGDEAGSIAPVLTDATGHFEIGGLTRVPWTVVAEAQAGKLRGRAAHITPDATITVQALGITALRGAIHVAGAPPVSFSVELDGPTRAERTFEWTDGTFAFERVDAGTYTIKVTSSAGNAETTAQVAAGAGANVDITLAANAVVIGKVTDPAGKPLGGIPITTVPDDGSGGVRVSLSGPPPQTQPDGTFRIETKAGMVVVVAMVPPRPVTKRGVVLEAGKTTDAGTLVVNAGPPTKP